MKLGKPFPRLIVLLGLAAIVGSLSMTGARTPSKAPVEIRPVWTEFKWPFPLDQWGVGRAFVCTSADCGSEVNIYLRPKIGFCNCTTGVIDDEELDRVGDKELITPEAIATGPGRSVEIAWMKGRSRTFEKTDTTPTELLSMAFHDGCNLMVAVATFTPRHRETMELAVTAFLASDRVLRWVKWLAL
jgi:hypothetical protein